MQVLFFFSKTGYRKLICQKNILWKYGLLKQDQIRGSLLYVYLYMYPCVYLNIKYIYTPHRHSSLVFFLFSISSLLLISVRLRKVTWSKCWCISKLDWDWQCQNKAEWHATHETTHQGDSVAWHQHLVALDLQLGPDPAVEPQPFLIHLL